MVADRHAKCKSVVTCGQDGMMLVMFGYHCLHLIGLQFNLAKQILEVSSSLVTVLLQPSFKAFSDRCKLIVHRERLIRRCKSRVEQQVKQGLP